MFSMLFKPIVSNVFSWYIQWSSLIFLKKEDKNCNTDNGINFMIPILSDTFDMVYNLTIERGYDRVALVLNLNNASAQQ